MNRPTPPRIVTARTPEDVLALVPLVLGFHPDDSIVMLTIGSPGETFHARVDLPGRHDAHEATAPLLAATLRHGVPRVLFVLYTDHAARAAAAAADLVQQFLAHDVAVVDVLRVDRRRWFRVEVRDGRVTEGPGVDYDVGAHPLAAEAVLQGTVTHGSRTDLAASLAADPEAVATMERALVFAATVLRGAQAPAERAWVADIVDRAARAGDTLSDAEVARLLVDLGDTWLRDAAWATMTRSTAAEHVRFWTDVLRRTPARLAPAPACLLAFAAWLSGHGALAWCALDRCLEVAPGYSLAGHLTMLLEAAVPPSVWDGLPGDGDREFPLPG